MGEDQAFAYLKDLHRNVSAYPKSGTGPIKAVARGEATVSVSFVHDGPTEAMAGFPVNISTPCEGTGYEIGSMSIIKGARNPDGARKFFDWALTPAAQKLGAETKQYQLPSNRATPVHPLVPDLAKIKLIDYDFVKYGKTAERKRLIGRWDRDIGSQPK
jgi:iron(III) transport system substrate-binding protein